MKRSQARRSKRVRAERCATEAQSASESCAQPRSDRSAMAISDDNTLRPSTVTRMQFHSTSVRSRFRPAKCTSPAECLGVSQKGMPRMLPCQHALCSLRDNNLKSCRAVLEIPHGFVPDRTCYRESESVGLPVACTDLGIHHARPFRHAWCQLSGGPGKASHLNVMPQVSAHPFTTTSAGVSQRHQPS